MQEIFNFFLMEKYCLSIPHWPAMGCHWLSQSRLANSSRQQYTSIAVDHKAQGGEAVSFPREGRQCPLPGREGSVLSQGGEAVSSPREGRQCPLPGRRGSVLSQGGKAVSSPREGRQYVARKINLKCSVTSFTNKLSVFYFFLLSPLILSV